MMLDHFFERQQLHPAPLLLIAGAAGFEAAMSILLPAPPSVHVVQWVFVGALLAIAFVFRQMIIRVSAQALVFGFGPIQKRVSLADIKTVRVAHADLMRAGIGVHLMGNGLWAWIAKTGTAVEIHLDDDHRPNVRGFILSTSRPNDLISALQSGQTSRAIETS